MLHHLSPSTHGGRAHGPFKIRRIQPGAMLGNPLDGGFGGLGLLDHANLSQGLSEPMHAHRDEEIISYLRAGSAVSTDSTGVTGTLRPDRLTVMNAGTGISHDGTILEPIEMLQIFVRPNAASLEPGMQYHDLGSAEAADDWRLLTGPEGSEAPTTVRQQIYLYDTRLGKSQSRPVPVRAGFDPWLYVFNGSIEVDGKTYGKHDAIAVTGGDAMPAIIAREDADLVLFLVDRTAPQSRAGAMSGR